MERFGIRLPMNAPVRSLGVALQQQTEIICALARDARVIVMDEPTARFAPDECEHLFSVMHHLAGAGASIIFISHFLDEVIAVADTITVMRDGTVCAEMSAPPVVGEDSAGCALWKTLPSLRRPEPVTLVPSRWHATGSDQPSAILW